MTFANDIKNTEAANYILVTDMSQKLNYMKRYETGYANPKSGRMIINMNGVNYFVEITPVDDRPIGDTIRDNMWWLN